MKRAVIVHGTLGSANGNWFQDVASQLREHGYQTTVPQFPTPEGQNLDIWLTHFSDTVGELDKELVVIGHSVGAVFTLRLLERLQRPISAAVLVAGFTGTLGLPEFDKLNSSFVAGAFNWSKIRANAHAILCISGDDDPYVPFEQGKSIADALGVEHLVVPGGGHLNAESGYTKFPRLVEELKQVGILAAKI